jgi:hypothetical protein
MGHGAANIIVTINPEIPLNQDVVMAGMPHETERREDENSTLDTNGSSAMSSPTPKTRTEQIRWRYPFPV